jgi:hypothetical protein
MGKYLKFERDGNSFIFAIDGLVFVEQLSAKTTLVYSNMRRDGSQLAVNFPTAALSASEQTEQRNAMVNAVAEALAGPWTQPFYTFTLPHPLNGNPEITNY